MTLKPDQEVDQRTWRQVVQKDCRARQLNREDAMDHSRWKKMIKDDWWSEKGWVDECFFLYRLYLVVPDKGPQNGCRSSKARMVEVPSLLQISSKWNMEHIRNSEEQCKNHQKDINLQTCSDWKLSWVIFCNKQPDIGLWLFYQACRAALSSTIPSIYRT